jgi:hypothetical protein
MQGAWQLIVHVINNYSNKENSREVYKLNNLGVWVVEKSVQRKLVRLHFINKVLISRIE